jgi:cysteine synthase A
MHALSRRLGRPVGGSTGTNLVAALACAQQMRERGESGAIVALLCDGGQRYSRTYHDAAWLQAQGLGCDHEAAAVDAWLSSGTVPAALPSAWRLAGDLA